MSPRTCGTPRSSLLPSSNRVRRQAVVALSRRGAATPLDLRSSELLSEVDEGYSYEPSNKRALRAARALAEMKDPGAVDALLEALPGPVHGFRKEVPRGVER